MSVGVQVYKDASVTVDEGTSVTVDKGVSVLVDEGVSGRGVVVRGAVPRWPFVVRRSMRSRRMTSSASTSRQMRGVALAEVRPSTTTEGLALGWMWSRGGRFSMIRSRCMAMMGFRRPMLWCSVIWVRVSRWLLKLGCCGT